MVPLLGSPSRDVQCLAAGVLLNLSDADIKAVQRACARAGAAAALLQLLASRSSSAEAQQEAAKALRQLEGQHAAHRRATMAHPGSISTLQRILLKFAGAGSAPTLEARLAAIEILRHLTLDDYATAIIPAVPTVVRCLRSPNADLVGQAASLLADVARYNVGARQAIVSAGGIPALGAVLHSFEGMTVPAAAAGTALRTVSLGNPQAAAAAVRALGLEPGHPREQALAEMLVAGLSLAPEHAVLPPELHLPGLSFARFPLQASGYRCGAGSWGWQARQAPPSVVVSPACLRMSVRPGEVKQGCWLKLPALGSQQAAS